MKTDIKFLLEVLDDFFDAFERTEVYLHGDEKDAKIKKKIEQIKLKYKL